MLFASTIFDLTPDTDYDVRLVLDDPDGGGTERILTARTWNEPELPSPLRTLHVAPGAGGGSGTAGDPFLGLAAADASAQPGDRIIVHGGQYNGAFAPQTSGATGAPVLWLAAAGETPVVNGAGASHAIYVNALNHVIIDGLTIRNGGRGVTVRNSAELAIKRCRIYDVQHGIDASLSGTANCHIWISDNTLEGALSWPRSSQPDYRGIQVSGRSIVLCHNRVWGFYDGIDISNYPPNIDIDVYLNDISECMDDGIELDYGDYNTRAFRNRLTNCYQGVSLQPSRGGPNFVVRNAMYNIAVEAFKLHSVGGEETAGAVILHNTVVKHGIPFLMQTSYTVHDTLILNNLFVGDVATYAMEFSAPTDNVLFDYDVFCGGPFGKFCKVAGVRYDTQADAAAAGVEVHGAYFSG